MPLRIQDYDGPRIPQYIEGTLAANTSTGLTAVGDKFYIIEADGDLYIKTDITPEQLFTSRRGQAANDNALYQRIEIFNRSAGPITFRIFYGFGNFLDGTSNIIGTVSITGAVPLPTGASTAAKQDTLAGLVSTAAKQDAAAVLVGAVNEAAPGTDTADSGLNGRLQRIAQRITSLIALVPAALDAAGRFKIGKNALGAINNAWNNELTGAGGASDSLDTLDASQVSAMGDVDGATTLEFEVSQDNVNYYQTGVTVVLVGAGDFHFSLTTAAKYVRLTSSADVTANATLVAKS